MGIRAKISIVVVATQAVIILCITAAALMFTDSQTALAALVGGVIGMLATAVFSLRVFAGQPEWSPSRFLQRFYRAEVQKLVLIAIMLFAAIEWMHLAALPLTLVCAAALMANWLVLLFRLN